MMGENGKERVREGQGKESEKKKERAVKNCTLRLPEAYEVMRIVGGRKGERERGRERISHPRDYIILHPNVSLIPQSHFYAEKI